MMLRHGGVPFTDKVLTWPEWAAAKAGAFGSSRVATANPCFAPADAPAAAARTYAFDRLPVLEVNGRAVAESGAIARLVARYAGLCASDAVDAAALDAVHDAANDLEAIEPIFNGFKADAPAEVAAHFALFATRCEQLQRLLGSQPFFGGASPLWADFTAFHFWDLSVAVRPEAAKGLEAMAAWAGRMRAVPAVAAQLAARPPAGPGA